MTARMYLARTSFFILACAVITPTLRANAVEPLDQGVGYVVLTDLADNDPYFAAARRLQEHRSARLIRFSPGNVAETLARIRQARPMFVAIVVNPETLDINFAFDVLELAMKVDDDPFADFAYGFITGATATDALGLVEGTIRAEATKSPPGGLLVAFGPTSTPQADKGNTFEWLPDWRRKRIEHKPGRFPQENLPDLASADVIRFWGHGSPESVDGGLEQSDLGAIAIRARMVFAGPCLSAVTNRYYDAPAKSNKLKTRHVDPGKSLALTFLSKGALAYFGALHDDRCISAGQEMEHAFTSGEPVGMTMKHTLDRIAMAHPTGIVRLNRFRAGDPPPTEKGLEAQLRWAAARILIGDPAFVPFADHVGPAAGTKMRSTGSSLSVEITIADPRIRSTFVNPFRDDLCKCEDDNDTLYSRSLLPITVGAIQRVRHIALPACLESVKHDAVQWREENWRGERFLHIQIDFRHDTLAKIAPNTVVRFDVETDGVRRMPEDENQSSNTNSTNEHE